LSAQDYKERSDGFYSAFELGFLEKLNLKKFRFLYSNELENTWDAYQATETWEVKHATTMEEEVEKVKQRARGEEDIHCYYKTLIEEKQAPTECAENEYLESNLENHFFENKKIEEEAQDYFDEMAQKHGEAVFEEKFWRDREECEAYGINPDGNQEEDFLYEWAMEEEIISNLRENNVNRM